MVSPDVDPIETNPLNATFKRFVQLFLGFFPEKMPPQPAPTAQPNQLTEPPGQIRLILGGPRNLGDQGA